MTPTPNIGLGLRSVVVRTLLFASAWLALAGADPSSWIIGIPAIALATFAAMHLGGQQNDRLRLLGAIRFVPFFLIESVRGGMDVASRVMRPRMRIAPGLSTYRMRLIGPNARIFFLDSISLLPGTLSADMRGAQVHVHALDIGDDIGASLERLERRVADLFGETLEPARHD